MLVVFIVGFIPVLPIGWNEFSMVEWSEIPSWAIAALAFIVIGTTFLAYLLNAYALAIVSPAIVSIYIYLQPVLAAFIALLWGKDELNTAMVVSAILVFAGVYMTSRPEKEVVTTEN
jgi:drug/metabolite transporter (DMT)-like permease